MIRIPNRLHISRIVPIMLGGAVSVVLLSGEGWHRFDNWGGAAMFCSLSGLMVLIDWTYTVSYDDTHILMTGPKWDFVPGWKAPTTIFYDNIHAVYGEMGRGGAVQAKFMPFDHVRIEGDLKGQHDHIMVSPNFLNVEGCRELMRVIYSKRPEVVDEEVLAFMNSDKKW